MLNIVGIWAVYFWIGAGPGLLWSYSLGHPSMWIWLIGCNLFTGLKDYCGHNITWDDLNLMKDNPIDPYSGLSQTVFAKPKTMMYYVGTYGIFMFSGLSPIMLGWSNINERSYWGLVIGMFAFVILKDIYWAKHLKEIHGTSPQFGMKIDQRP